MNPTIKHGEYLAKVSNCIACHTSSDNKPYAGGLAIETPFGVLYSSNITPNKKTGIGKWSEVDFRNALKRGISPKSQHYYPAFPYPYYSNISNQDVHALYQYFMSIPAIKNITPKSSLVFRLPLARKFMRLWNWWYLEPRTNPILDRGEYLVKGPGHCGMCHTPSNWLVAPLKKHYLGGAFIGGYWAPNLTKLALDDTETADIINVFSNNELLNHAGPLAGPMADVSENSLRFLSHKDKIAIASYLKKVNSLPTLDFYPTKYSKTKTLGKQVYEQTCSICHDSGKMGAPRLGNRAGWLNRLKQHGIKRLYQRTTSGYNSMPKKGACDRCDEQQLLLAVNYMLQQSLSFREWKKIQITSRKTH